MSLCPICGNYLCDHTAEQRGQTYEEMGANLTPEEEKAHDYGNEKIKILAALKNRRKQHTDKEGKLPPWFIGDIFTLPVFNEAHGSDRNYCNKYRENLQRMLRAQIESFNARSGEFKLIPTSCYTFDDEDSVDVANAMPDIGFIVTYVNDTSIELKPNQAFFTYGY